MFSVLEVLNNSKEENRELLKDDRNLVYAFVLADVTGVSISKIETDLLKQGRSYFSKRKEIAKQFSNYFDLEEMKKAAIKEYELSKEILDGLMSPNNNSYKSYVLYLDKPLIQGGSPENNFKKRQGVIQGNIAKKEVKEVQDDKKEPLVIQSNITPSISEPGSDLLTSLISRIDDLEKRLNELENIGITASISGLEGKKVTASFKVNKGVLDELDRYCKTNQVTKSDIVSQAIHEYLKGNTV